ncbi:MAG TPA: AtpZ/AtpI family protein [Dongiaceae bacterium]|jgi:ATP synthase protein I|nr:AtpZ/AtpI family protein [Dongiaceae bacterium]
MDPKDSDKFRRLDRELEELKNRTEHTAQPSRETNREAGVAGLVSRISIELVVGLLVGLGAGYYLDRWLGTKPLFLITLMILGLAAGILNIVRLSKDIERRLRKDE